MQNLRDKLLKAGLVTEDQAKNSETEASRRRERSPAPPPQQAREGGSRSDGGQRNVAVRPPVSRPPPRPAARPPEESRIPKLPPLPGSKAHQRMESKKQLELDRKLRELVHAGQVPAEPGARTFYFVTRKGRLRRMEVSEAQAALLESGQLAVVERPEPAQIEHSLVSPQTADQMLALSARSVRFFNRAGSPVGFISDEELKVRQEAEKTAGPEVEGRDDAPDEVAGEEVPSQEPSGTPPEG
jgi:hypothetical protein